MRVMRIEIIYEAQFEYHKHINYKNKHFYIYYMHIIKLNFTFERDYELQ